MAGLVWLATSASLAKPTMRWLPERKHRVWGICVWVYKKVLQSAGISAVTRNLMVRDGGRGGWGVGAAAMVLAHASVWAGVGDACGGV